MKNNKGFTLIEMIVVIAVIAALSITVGFSTTKVHNSTQVSMNKETLNEIFNAGRIYSNLSESPDGCPEIQCETSCEIPLSCLIAKGLLDFDITKKKNPLTDENFKETDKVVVNKTSEETEVSIMLGDKLVSNKYIEDNYNDIEDWGKKNE